MDAGLSDVAGSSPADGPAFPRDHPAPRPGQNLSRWRLRRLLNGGDHVLRQVSEMLSQRLLCSRACAIEVFWKRTKADIGSDRFWLLGKKVLRNNGNKREMVIAIVGERANPRRPNEDRPSTNIVREMSVEWSYRRQAETRVNLYRPRRSCGTTMQQLVISTFP